ncbi:zinc finger protein 862-like [Oratosquilla oratoria]|uniref:zinc finger protein 862-like n=1 Tax=Oratosquilla oratoria TaxID=337810 RepID=UPI003F7575DD
MAVITPTSTDQIDMAPKRKFRDVWMADPAFQPWLSSVIEDPEKASCVFCKRQFGAHLTAITRHKETKMHILNAQKFEDLPKQETSSSPVGASVAVAVALLMAFIAEHNLSFSIIDHMVELMKVMFPDSAIAQGIHMHKTKCTETMKSLANVITEDLVKKLRIYKFSIIIDETTDVSCTKTCAVLVRYFDLTSHKINSCFFSLINLYSSSSVGSTVENLYEKLMETLDSHNIPRSNFIGFAADGASKIMGENNSLTGSLKDSLPGITVLRCICHSIHLAASEAAKQLPRKCEDLLRDIYSFFSHSAKRKHELKIFQIFCNVKPHKILHPCQTRWLSYHEAVARILEQWRQPLRLYFIE